MNNVVNISPQINLHHGDCMKAMAKMKDNTYDLAIVDPPYGIKQTWSKSRKDRFYKKGKLFSYQNTKRPERKYFKELMRVSKNQIIWGGNYFVYMLPITNSWCVWNKHLDKSKQGHESI